MSNNEYISEEDIKNFIDSLEVPFERLFVESSSFGNSVGYSLNDGREFDLAIDSQELESKVIEYLISKGVTIKKM
jgi:hypothetical protein